MTKSYDLIVVGGGISGLSTAYIAARSGQSVLLLEGSSEFGGLLRTFDVGGTALEFYYHHFFRQDAELMWLLRDLELNDKIFYDNTRMGIYVQGEAHDFSTLIDLLRFRPLSLWDKVKFIFISAFLGKCASWAKWEHVDALSWIRKYGGNSIADYVWGPLFKVKFGRHASNVPLAWLIGRLRQRMESRSKGQEQLGYLRGSLRVLKDALLKKLEDLQVDMVANVPIDDVMERHGIVKGVRSGDSSFYGSKVILTVPAPIAGKILSSRYQSLAQTFSAVKYFGALCMILELDRPLSPYYWLNIADPQSPMGGIIEHTNFIPPERYNGKHIVYLSRYFDHDEEFARLDEEVVKARMQKKLAEIFPGFDEANVHRTHVFKAAYAAPVCGLNYSKEVIPVKLPIEGLYQTSMMHIYPDERSVNNSIRVAFNACEIMGVKVEEISSSHSLSGQIGFDR